MMYLNVLVPMDGSEISESAVGEVLELASSMKSVHLLLVENTAYQTRQLEGFTFYVDKYVEVRKQSGMDYLAPFKEKLEEAGLEVTAEVGFGDPVPVIEKAVKRLRSDMVILGGNSGGWLERHLGLAQNSRQRIDPIKLLEPQDDVHRLPGAGGAKASPGVVHEFSTYILRSDGILRAAALVFFLGGERFASLETDLNFSGQKTGKILGIVPEVFHLTRDIENTFLPDGLVGEFIDSHRPLTKIVPRQ